MTFYSECAILKIMKKYIKKIVFTALTTMLAVGSAFAVSFDISSATSDTSIYSDEKSAPRGVRSGDYARSEISPYERRAAEEGESSSVFVDTNFSGASVYIDGSYKGTTPCTANNIAPGYHDLKVSRDHCETRTVRIYVEKETKHSFWVEIEKISGKIYFDVTPSSATLSCDGTTFTRSIEVDEGSHLFKARAFGYKDWSEYVTVYRGKKRNATLRLDVAPFEVTGFRTNKKEFNPNAGGKFSKIEFTASVTAPGTGKIEIVDEEGNAVWETSLNFQTWDTSASWNGKNYRGEVVPDGLYTAILYAKDYVNTIDLNISSTLLFQHMKITPDGSGIGAIASAELYPKGTIGVQLGGTFIKPLEGGPFLATRGGAFDAGFLWAINDHLELASDMSFQFYDDFDVQASVSFKGGSQINLSASKLYWALNARAGITTSPMFEPYGVDVGSGMALGLELGFTNNKMYYGFQSEYIFGAIKCALAQDESNLLKNAFLFQYSGKVISFSAGAAFITGFDSFAITTNTGNYFAGDCEHFINAIQGAVNLSFFLGSSAWCMDFEVDPYYFPSTGTLYANASVGLTAFF